MIRHIILYLGLIQVMKIIKLLKRIDKNRELNIELYKKEHIENKKDKLRFEKMLQKSVSMGLVMRKGNFLKLTKEGKTYLEKELKRINESTKKSKTSK